MSGEASVLEHVPSKVLWYILLGRKDLDDCMVALPWKKLPMGVYVRALRCPTRGTLDFTVWRAVVVPLSQPGQYDVRVDVPNRNQHHKGGFLFASEAMAYADNILTRYGIPYLTEQT